MDYDWLTIFVCVVLIYGLWAYYMAFTTDPGSIN